jgi:hypothetical protein
VGKTFGLARLLPLESRALLSASVLAADANGDGRVDSLDAAAVFQHFNQTANAPTRGDLNFDGIVNALDFNILASSFGKQISFAAPITITTGGTYTGAWQSTTTAPVIRVHTTDPVIIENSTVQGRGELIVSDFDHTDITVRNTRGYALNPNVAGQIPGRFFDSTVFNHVVLENNYLQGTSGIVMEDFEGNKSAASTIRVVGNVALNIDGRKSDGAGGYLNYNLRTSKSDGHTEQGYDDVQFFQMGACTSVANVEIAWNQVINEPGNSRVEDNISIYKSSGTASSPIRIHDNYIQGAYTIKPAQKDTSDSSWTYDWSYSGGGIMLGDGTGTSIANACGFVQAYNNEVIDTTNYGMAITAGHDSSFYSNRILSAGVTPDGTSIAAQNVGAAIWDSNNDASRSPPTWFSDSGHDNQVGWIYGAGRNDWWTPSAASWTNNTHWPGTITLATQSAEFNVWRAKLTSNAIWLGTQ